MRVVVVKKHVYGVTSFVSSCLVRLVSLRVVSSFDVAEVISQTGIYVWCRYRAWLCAPRARRDSEI